MEYVTLGKTQRRVSRLGFGGAPAGLKNYLRGYDPKDRSAREEVIRAVRRAFERGVTYFDTAPAYGGGTSEELLGEALEGAGSDVFIATKYGLWQDQTPRESLEASLQRLRREQVDLLQLHGLSWSRNDVEHILASGGVADQMEELRGEGLVRHLGFTSEDNNDALYALIRSDRFDVMQICYNLIAQHPHDPVRPFGSLLVAEEHGMGITAMRPTTSGVFQKWIRAVRPQDDFDYTPALIQFVLSNPLVDVVIVGMRSVDHVEANVQLVGDRDGRVDIKKLYGYYDTDRQT